MKLGTKSITREGFEYELTVNFEFLNDKHLVQASKDRTELFSGKPEFIINSSTGKKLIQWCNQGISIETVKNEILFSNTPEELKEIYAKYPTLKSQIHPFIMDRKAIIDKDNYQIIPENQIVQPLKNHENESSIK
jgi:hypothetical protein